MGSALGLVSLALEHTPMPLATLSALGGPWLVVAFLAGRLVPLPLPSALAGFVTLVAATAAYYVAKPLVGSPINPIEYDTPVFWLVLAATFGPVVGSMGGLTTSPRATLRVAVAALLAGIVVAEPLMMLLAGGPWSPFVAAVAVVGLLLPVAFLRRPGEILVAVTLGAAAAGAVALLADLLLPYLFLLR
jgi:hypothetical protein